jgi:hypothetical protein
VSTASGLEREQECPTSAVLSPVVQESSEDAERGNAIHVFCRSVIAGTPRSIALAAVPEGPWRETCEQIDFGVLCGGVLKVRAEVAYRLDAETDEVTELGINIGRRYPPRTSASQVDGTNDFEGFSISGVPVVTDIKTGFYPVTRCAENPQMQFHARVQMLRHDVDRVEARIAYIDVGGQIGMDTHVFTRFELDTFNDRLLERHERIARANAALKAGERVTVNAGSWCRWCPVKDSCPRYTTLAMSMLGQLRDVKAEWKAMTPEQKAQAYLLARDAREIAERVEEAMKDLARTSPVPLPGGKELRDTGTGVRVVNAPRPARRGRSAA